MHSPCLSACQFVWGWDILSTGSVQDLALCQPGQLRLESYDDAPPTHTLPPTYRHSLCHPAHNTYRDTHTPPSHPVSPEVTSQKLNTGQNICATYKNWNDGVVKKIVKVLPYLWQIVVKFAHFLPENIKVEWQDHQPDKRAWSLNRNNKGTMAEPERMAGVQRKMT